MNQALTQDPQTLLLGLGIAAGLFLLSLSRIYRLSRSNARLCGDAGKMEKQAVLQQLEATSIHHDAMSWRAKTQRQFDALRAEFSHRLLQSDQGGANALKEWEQAHQKALSQALAKISDLEAALAARPVAPPPAPFVPPPFSKPSLPPLPAVDSARVQSLEAELAAAKAEIASSRQQNAALQRALLLARRRPQPPVTRKSSPRSAARCA